MPGAFVDFASRTVRGNGVSLTVSGLSADQDSLRLSVRVAYDPGVRLEAVQVYLGGNCVGGIGGQPGPSSAQTHSR
jgi:hypothetical protein